MLRPLIFTLIIIVSVTLSGCSVGVTNLQHYTNATKGYEFLYPNGWMEVEVKNASEGVETVFHDLIQRSENLSVIVSKIPEGKTLSDLGTPSEVGYRFLKQINSDPNSDREAELLDAESRESNGKTYYTLEYEVKIPNRPERHDIASIAVSRNKLYTFNLSTDQKRWGKVSKLFKTVVNSFLVY
ncbi:MAG: photosystem II reaction center PsbP family protein [Hydrococcus sp. Prado102]|nr:photosystem II reaction center PsbP family protein [Hydrococcus sp. Prado102]